MTDYCEAIFEELRISRKVIRAGEEVTLRFVVFAPTARYIIMALLPLGIDRSELFYLARLFLVWKAATGFILSGELMDPDSLVSVYVSREEAYGARQAITRESPMFTEPLWYGRDEVADEILNVMPPKTLKLTAFDMETINDFEDGHVKDLTWFETDI